MTDREARKSASPELHGRHGLGAWAYLSRKTTATSRRSRLTSPAARGPTHNRWVAVAAM
jgi:hypothetical protein